MIRTLFQFRFVILLVAAAGCTDRSFTPVMPSALAIGESKSVFVGTTRAEEPDGSFGFRRSAELRHLELTVSIPPTHEPGTLNFAYARPNPLHQFTLAGQRELASAEDFKARLRGALSDLPPIEREVTVFVHGYNATQNETAFRAAQLAHDIRLPGELVIYSWPSRGKALAYAYDGDSILYARDGLERLLRDVADIGASRVLLVAHSMGSALVMETLRQMDIDTPGWPASRLSGVVLISPDLDIQVFRSQISRMSAVPEPFVVMVSQKDKVLNISARLRGTIQQSRLGNLENAEKVRDLPVSIVDATPFSDGAGSGHFIPATSPALIALLLRAGSVSSTFRPETLTLTNLLIGRPEVDAAPGLVALPPDPTKAVDAR